MGCCAFMPVPCSIWSAASGQSVATRSGRASRRPLNRDSASFIDSSEVLLLEPPRPVDGGAPFHRLHLGAGEAQHVGRLGAEVLRLEVARKLIRDPAGWIGKARIEPALG